MEARQLGTKGPTVAQPAIAWVAAQGPDIVPLVGERRRDRLAEGAGRLIESLAGPPAAAIVPHGGTLHRIFIVAEQES